MLCSTFKVCYIPHSLSGSYWFSNIISKYTTWNHVLTNSAFVIMIDCIDTKQQSTEIFQNWPSESSFLSLFSVGLIPLPQWRLIMRKVEAGEQKQKWRLKIRIALRCHVVASEKEGKRNRVWYQNAAIINL